MLLALLNMSLPLSLSILLYLSLSLGDELMSALPLTLFVLPLGDTVHPMCPFILPPGEWDLRELRVGLRSLQ
jgi:hypothetical protein